MKSLAETFLLARSNDSQAIESLIFQFTPLIRKMAWKTGTYDEDCFQECALALFVSIFRFEVRK